MLSPAGAGEEERCLVTGLQLWDDSYCGMDHWKLVRDGLDQVMGWYHSVSSCIGLVLFGKLALKTSTSDKNQHLSLTGQ